MTILGTAELQRLTLRVLLPTEGDAPGAEALAAAAHRAYDDLARVTVPLIGHIGVAAITDRASHLATRGWPARRCPPTATDRSITSSPA